MEEKAGSTARCRETYSSCSNVPNLFPQTGDGLIIGTVLKRVTMPKLSRMCFKYRCGAYLAHAIIAQDETIARLSLINLVRSSSAFEMSSSDGLHLWRMKGMTWRAVKLTPVSGDFKRSRSLLGVCCTRRFFRGCSSSEWAGSVWLEART